MDIRHIPRKKNLVDSLSRQLVSDALVRKGSSKDANAEYVQKLPISDSATDQDIQKTLYKLFKSSLQGSIQSTNEATSPQGIETRPTVVAVRDVPE